MFYKHIDFYSNKAISTIKCMKILGNLIRELNPHQKHLLYRSYVLLIALYRFQLWYYYKATLLYLLKMLGKLQRRVAIWILEAFKTSSSFSIEAITRLISINLHLQKLSERLQLHMHSLLANHILCSLIEAKPNLPSIQHALSLNSLTRRQCKCIKDHIVDMNNQYNKVFPSFDPLNPEFSPGHRIIDIFNSRFSFHLFSKHSNQNFKLWIQKLDNLALESSSTPSNVLVITDASIKNNITTSISHIHIHSKPIVKILHHAVNVTSTEAELFAIRCGINQATNLNDISKIIVVTDSIHTARKIFDPISYPFQKHSAAILNELWVFFSHYQENSIEFWECPSQCK